MEGMCACTLIGPSTHYTKSCVRFPLALDYPSHKAGLLKLLDCKEDRADVATKLEDWYAEDFETAASAAGMCATALRTFSEWDMHPQRKALNGIPPMQLVKIGEAPKRNSTQTPPSRNPLEGIRVLDLTRVIAGPVCGRTLAAYGAEVLWITSDSLPSLPLLDCDTSRGKIPLSLDLTTESDKQRLSNLIKDSDVFLQGYRPGRLQAKGFGVHDIIQLRPGMVCANLCAYGFEGPWKDRRGKFDSLTQTATGLNFAEGEAYASFVSSQGGISEIKPLPFPMQALDHAAGYFLTLGINLALANTVTEGGSWEVRVSLAGVADWVRSLGRIDGGIAFRDALTLPPSGVDDEEVRDLSEEWKTHTGLPMTAIRHAAIFSE